MLCSYSFVTMPLTNIIRPHFQSESGKSSYLLDSLQNFENFSILPITGVVWVTYSMASSFRERLNKICEAKNIPCHIIIGGIQNKVFMKSWEMRVQADKMDNSRDKNKSHKDSNDDTDDDDSDDDDDDEDEVTLLSNRK